MGWEAKRHLIVLILMLLAIAACESPIHTTFDVDHDADLSRYASYAWIPIESAAGAPDTRHGGYVSPLDRQRIVRAVEHELAARGYTTAEHPSEADLLVAYAIGKKERTEFRGVAGRSSTYYPGYGPGTGYGGPTTEARVYKEGTLIVEFYDRATRQAVWVGVASKKLTRHDESEEGLRAAVAAILEPFPARTRQ